MLYLNRILLLCGALILGALIGGHLNNLHPALDSLSHFRLHLAVTGVALAMILAALGNRLGAAALSVISLLTLILTIWPSFRIKPVGVAHGGGTYRLVQANLRFDNRTPEAFLRLLAREKPDVATLQEVSEIWLPKLKTINAAYPHQLICPGTNRVGGVAILSRRPFAAGGLSVCANDGALAIQSVDFNGSIVTVVSLHLKWPWPHGQAAQLSAMGQRFEQIDAAGLPVIMGGDLNAVPWSATAATIARATGTQILPQWRGTWLLAPLPANWAEFAGLPIDNILSGGLVLQLAKMLPAMGSDHRPLLIKFTIPEPAKPEAKKSETSSS
jgi:endonuclease/exonuclease/phosphatase (EEP) superfamily protein YafD